MANVSIIGSGSWGTALAILLSDNGHKVKMWSTTKGKVENLRKEKVHPSLPNVILPDSLEYSDDLEYTMNGAELLVLAVPSIYTRQVAAKMREFYKPNQVIVNVAKGIEESTLKILSVQIEEEIPNSIVTVLSGPSHAEEVSRRLPTTCVVGAYSKEKATYVQNIFMNPVFRVYTSPDMLGIELGGSLKNVIALAAGISDGLGYGDNTKAAIITRGIAEMSRLGIKMGASYYSFAGLSGIGDLIVTCASRHSRNRKAGFLIGQGLSMQEAIKEVKMVVEGVYSAKAAKGLAVKYGVSMPIVEEVNLVLFEGKSPKAAVDDLMQRQKITESLSLDWN
jgi:hypothetical protein